MCYGGLLGERVGRMSKVLEEVERINSEQDVPFWSQGGMSRSSSVVLVREG
jgi:hypothetical protein